MLKNLTKQGADSEEKEGGSKDDDDDNATADREVALESETVLF